MEKSVGTFLFSILAITAINLKMAQAQKLPEIQTTSVKAPTAIKIDGKPAEWSKFEAYNNANELYYTISNDNNNLYVVAQATYHSLIAKIVYGGITLTIKNSDKNSQTTPFSITYPYNPNAWGSVSYELRTNPTLTESQLSNLNNKISGPLKEIPLTGAKGISDASISVYNELGIKANGLVDDKKAYTCEIAIPLKYIAQVIDANGKFSYRLQVNGMDTSGKDGNVVVGGFSLNGATAPVSRDSENYITSPTHLDGTYTLAK